MSEKSYKNSLRDVTLYEYRCALSGDWTVLRYDMNKGSQKEDEEAFDALYDDYLQRFGLGDDYQEYADIQMELIDLYSQFIESDNAFLRNRIRHLETRLSEMHEKSDNKGDLDDAIVVVSKWIGTVINEKKVTAMFFFKAMENCIKEQQQIKAQYNGEEQD